MKKIILCSVLFLVIMVETSCGEIFQNATGGEAVSEGSVSGESVSGESVSEDKVKDLDSEQNQVTKESLDITFEDALGNQQKLKTGEVDKDDVGVKLCDEILDNDCFTEGNHFYYKIGIEVFQDKGKKMGELDDWESEYIVAKWGKYGEKFYLGLYELYYDNYIYYDEPRMYKFVTVDLNSWKINTINCSELYTHGMEMDMDIFVYNNKIYIQDKSVPKKLDEIDMNGKKTRTILLGDIEGKEDNTILQGIVDGKIYYFTWNVNQHMLKSRDLVTGVEEIVMQYEQPVYNKNELRYRGSYFHISGNNLFIVESYLDKKREEKCKIYQLPLKNGGKMKCVLNRFIIDYNFLDDDIYYIDNKYLLHRKNLKEGTEQIISERKLEAVNCTINGLFVNTYVERQGYDDYELFYMDFDGKHEKKIARLW